MLWFYLALLATALWAVTNILDKFIISSIRKPFFTTIMTGLIALIASFIVFLFFKVAVAETQILLLCIVAGLMAILATFFYFKSVLVEEISRAVPILQTITIFVLIFAAIFLAEILTPIKYFGIALLLVGSFLISAEKAKTIKLRKGFWLMIVASAIYAAHNVLVKYLLQFISYWSAFFWVGIGMFFGAVLILLWHSKEFFAITKKFRRPVAYNILNEGISSIAGFIAFIALSIGLVSLISAITATQSFFVFLYATVLTLFKPSIIKEELNAKIIAIKLVAIAIMFSGAVLLI